MQWRKKKYARFIHLIILFVSSENITNTDEDPSKYLNSISNNSNSSPELIEYYDVDDVSSVSSAPDPIYPDPESIFNQNLPENRPFDVMVDAAAAAPGAPPKTHRKGLSKNGATKFNKLQELNNPIDGFDNDDGDNDDTNRKLVISTVELITTTMTTKKVDGNQVDRSFKGKSIDFNIRHTMEELRNEDLRDHDIIDNIMYIYYGSNVALRKSLGGSIIIVGTVFALAAQILAIIFTLLRNR